MSYISVTLRIIREGLLLQGQSNSGCKILKSIQAVSYLLYRNKRKTGSKLISTITPRSQEH
jgi:hypothetical protein